MKMIFFSLSPGKRKQIILLKSTKFHCHCNKILFSPFSVAYSVPMFPEEIGSGLGSLSGQACCFFVLCNCLPSNVPHTGRAYDYFHLWFGIVECN